MSDFFKSEIVQDELEVINDMQEELYDTMLEFGEMLPEEKKDHIERLQILLDKQRVMYTRLSLSDDPIAVELRQNLRKSVQLMGFPPNTDINTLFNSMNESIENLKTYVDK